MGIVVARVFSVILSMLLSVYVAREHEGIALQYGLDTRYITLCATLFGLFSVQTLSYYGLTYFAKLSLRLVTCSSLLLTVIVPEITVITSLSWMIFICKYRGLISNKIYDRRMSLIDGILFYVSVPIAFILLLIWSEKVATLTLVFSTLLYANIEWIQRKMDNHNSGYDWLTLNGVSGIVLNNIDLAITNMLDTHVALIILYLKKFSFLFEAMVQTTMQGWSKDEFYQAVKKYSRLFVAAVLIFLLILPLILRLLFNVELSYFSLPMLYLVVLITKSGTLPSERRIFESIRSIKFYSIANIVIALMMIFLKFKTGPMILLITSGILIIFNREWCKNILS